jgi:ABC-2 type transport system ATP-binding protein
MTAIDQHLHEHGRLQASFLATITPMAGDSELVRLTPYLGGQCACDNAIGSGNEEAMGGNHCKPKPADYPRHLGAICCRGVRKVYNAARRRGSTVAVEHVDLDIARGESFGLLGPNGAGKTTLVEILEGLILPTAGDVQVLGRTWSRDGDDLRARIGVALQQTRLPDRSTVRECLELFISLYPRSRPIEDLIAQVALNDKEHAQVSTLSGGQQQRLAIGCALAGEPELLFLDEPTTGLDPQSRRQIWELVQSFVASGGTVVLTTHSMDEAERLCDRVAVMDRGRIVRVGRPAELIAELGAANVIEFQANDAGLGIALLLALPGVTSARESSAGDATRWTLSAPEPYVTLPALFALAEREATRLAHLSMRSATLEDVFVSLTGRALRDQ